MTTALDMKVVRKKLADFAIPPRPEMLDQLQNEIEAPEPSLKRISAIIQQDVGIAGYTLKVVNSPLYSLPRKITSIEHACMFLGLTRLYQLVNSVVLRFTLSKGLDHPFSDRLWNSSTHVAGAAMGLAKIMCLDDDIVDELYTIGLFHNAGIALILKQNPEYPALIKQSYRKSGINIADFETEQLKASHELLGFLLAQTWGLTRELSNIIAYHHSQTVIFATGTEREKQLMAVLKLAEHMVGLPILFGETRKDFEWEKYSERILSILHIDNTLLADFGEQLKAMEVDNIYCP